MKTFELISHKVNTLVVPITPKKVAQVIVAGLHEESPEILVGWQSHLAVWCSRFVNFCSEKLIDKARKSLTVGIFLKNSLQWLTDYKN